MERLNPHTGKPFKYGDKREDGYSFTGYNYKELRKNGTFIELWMSPKRIERKRKYDKKRAEHISKKNHDWMKELKVKAGCACCGYNTHSEGLDFDHLSDKKFNVGRGGAYSKKRLEKEIKKCQILCGTCHHIKTRNLLKFNDLIKKEGNNLLLKAMV